MANAIRRLQISIAAQGRIESTWSMLDAEIWMLVEDEALVSLDADLSAIVSLFPIAALREALPKYIGFEQAQIDDAVVEAAYFVLGRPAMTFVHHASFINESIDYDVLGFDGRDDLMLTEDLGALPRRVDACRSSSRLRHALEWSRLGTRSETPSKDDFTNATIDADDGHSWPREVEVFTTRQPSPPLEETRSKRYRRRVNMLRPHALP